jgi:hypothetical protein
VILWPTVKKTRLPVRLYNGAQRAWTKLGRRPARFADSEAALLASAAKATGLSDFGEGTWREGLRVLLHCYDEEAQLTPFGRTMASQTVTGVLAARALTEAGWQARPECLKQEIRRPIFILGLPRTGTTALHFLLGQDPENQVLDFWLAGAPGPRPPRDRWEADPRFAAAAKALRTMYWLDPDLKAIHLMTVDGPEECRHLLAQSFVDDTFDSNATVPSYTKWFAEQDMGGAYQRHRDVLKLIGSATPERRWVLKYPAHIRHLDRVLETYPDACFIQTHRDPARVLPSLCSLVTGWRRLYEDSVDAEAVGRWQLDMWAGLMETGIEKRRKVRPEQFFDLHFRDVVSDPVAAVKRAYDHFGLSLSPDGERCMRSWHAQNPQGKHGGHRYTPEEFGLTEEKMAERFAGYREHFGVERERPGETGEGRAA